MEVQEAPEVVADCLELVEMYLEEILDETSEEK